MTVKVTSDLFAGLSNPYTGERLDVAMTVSPGFDEPMFSAPDAYSTYDVFPTKEECIAAWDRTDGVSGLRKGTPFVCAYTGEPLVLVKSARGWRFSGGFDPKMFFTRDEFLRMATMRRGVPGYVPSKSVRVTSVPRKPVVTEAARRAAESKAPSLDEGKVHELERRVNAIGVRVSGSVRVSKGKSRRGR